MSRRRWVPAPLLAVLAAALPLALLTALAVAGPRGVLKASGRPGPNHRPYAGRLGVRNPRPGRYLATIRARDTAGNPSMPRHAPFRIVARRYGPARAE